VPSSAADPEPDDAGPVPPPLRAAAAVVALEGLTLVGFAVYVAVAGTGRAANIAALAAFAGGAGVLLGLLARAVAGAHTWARSPVVVVQIVFLPVGVSLIQAGRGVVGAAVLVLAAAVLYLLFTPASRAALDR
jgi:hypothetical protein